jgi:hypothetical protein
MEVFMNAKNVILFLLVIVAIGSGLYLIQDKKQNKELAAHNIERFKQITTIAQKSRPAGMLEMASAINKFHQIKGHYPQNLIDLYPQFIPDESFITTLEWQYTPENNSYLLQKRVADEQIFATIGPNLRLQTGTPKYQLASAALPQEKQSQTQTKSELPQKTGPDIRHQTIYNAENKKVLTQQLPLVNNSNTGNKKKATKARQSSNLVKKELSRDEKFLLSFDENRFYIWKGNDGIIGFSDTQYPDEEKFSIYRNKGWFEYNDYQNSSSID